MSAVSDGVRQERNLLDIVEDLERRGIALVVLSMGGQRIDTRSPTGKLMLTMLGAIATFERDLMLERQREGIAKAAAEGKYKGRAPTARAKAADVLRMAGAGQTRDAIAADLGIGVASVYRILAEARAAGPHMEALPRNSVYGRQSKFVDSNSST